MREICQLPPLKTEWIDSQEILILLETNKFDPENRYSFLFINPLAILETFEGNLVSEIFDQIDEYSNHRYLAGFFSYELGDYFTNQIEGENRGEFPLIWLAVFEKPFIFDHHTGSLTDYRPEWLASSQAITVSHSISNLHLTISLSDYENRIQQIKKRIEAGDTYQVNFTTKYEFDFSGHPYSLYQELKKKQSVPYNAFIKIRDRYVLSISPELFFRKAGNHIVSRPMKGTMPRGRTLAEDQAQLQRLAADEKNRSENVMIVDLLRNDLGRVSKTGSVRVSNLYAVEKYHTLLQMTSTIESELKESITYFDLFKSIFPCGSVTGAPKMSTMKIIRELEKATRGVYTGAIGMISPRGDAAFNVPIRTLVIENGRGEMGVGSGIVYDSDARAEFEECQLKANFLIEQYREFSLIETILWSDGFQRLPLHMKRLRESAEYFDFAHDEEEILNKLRETEQRFFISGRYKVRLLLSKDGMVEMTHEPLPHQSLKTGRLAISTVRTSSRDVFLFHKTTLRDLYQREYERYSAQGFLDVIFVNEKDQVTEGAISNILVKVNGKYFTPPIECGLLNGVFRQEFLTMHSNAIEKILYLDDLRSGDEILLTNSVRGLVKVTSTRFNQPWS
jgi:para-aminobenzoate synthetase/4-amino-4-deoxychorismate lyase